MAIGSLGVGIAGLAGAMDTKAPRARSYGDEMRYALDVQGHRMPQWLRQEGEYAPQWQDLAMGQWGSALLGKEEGGTVAGRGVMDVFLNSIAPMMRQAQSGDRAADVADIEALTPRMREATRSSNPEVAALIDLLTGGAKANLENGLGAGERRELQQAIRGAQSARGMGWGPSDTFEEVYGVGREAENIKAERAMRAIGASQGFYGNPFSFLTQRGGVGTVAAGGALDLPGYLQQAAGGKYFNPESAYHGALREQGYATKAGINMTNANNRVQYGQMAAAGGDSIGKLAAGGI